MIGNIHLCDKNPIQYAWCAGRDAGDIGNIPALTPNHALFIAGLGVFRTGLGTHATLAL